MADSVSQRPVTQDVKVALSRTSGAPIGPDERLTTVTSEFIASGGDGVLATAGPVGDIKVRTARRSFATPWPTGSSADPSATRAGFSRPRIVDGATWSAAGELLMNAGTIINFCGYGELGT